MAPATLDRRGAYARIAGHRAFALPGVMLARDLLAKELRRALVRQHPWQSLVKASPAAAAEELVSFDAQDGVLKAYA